MSTDNVTMHHSRGELQGTVEWLFSEDATSAANAVLVGYLNMGNFLGFELKSDPKRTPKKSASRGTVFESGSTGAEVSLGVELMTKEVADMRKAKIALMAEDASAFTQTAIAAAAGDSLAFTADIPAKLNYDYPLTKTGVLLRHVSAAVLTFDSEVMVAGTDYILDEELGSVRFINAAKLPDDTVTTVVTVPAIDSTHAKYMEGLTPMGKPVRRGISRLMIWDQDDANRLVQEFEPRKTEIYTSGGYSVTHENQSEHKITVMFQSITERLLIRP